MSSELTDKDRLLKFKADGKTELLLPTAFSAVERMSGLFQIDVNLAVSPDKVGQVKVDQFLGKKMNLRVSHGEDYSKGPYRYFDGMCSRFASVGKDAKFSYFRAQIVPWLWLLTKRADFRVYQDKSAIDIVESVLKDLQQDFSDFQFEIRANRGQYKKIDYCVQFHETQFNFVSRLLEQNGVYYYFEHTESGHKMIVDDSLSAGNDVPNQAEVQYFSTVTKENVRDDSLIVLCEEREIHSGKFAARDYHSQLAQNKIDFSGISPKTILAKNDKLEMFDWPSGSGPRYNQTDQRLDEVNSTGNTLTNLRAQASEAIHHTFTGSSRCRGFTPGYRFSIKQEPGKKYLLTEVQHDSTQHPVYSTDMTDDKPYSNTFVTIPSDVQYRPQRVTPKPVVEGIQSAKVVGRDDDEIYVDKYGRVRVQFFWDRKGQNNEKSTCWVRVAQISAGKRWGASFWPRIGQEVVVAFLEGDPDQPVIVGSLYNNQQMPPYLGDGPDDNHKTDPNVSGIKTNSTKGGDGFNELRFDDTKDKEQVFIHAEKDMDVKVKSVMREHILGERNIVIGDESQNDSEKGNLFQLVNRDWTLKTRGNKKQKVEGNDYLTVGNGDSSDGGNAHLYVQKDRIEQIGGNQSLKIDGNRSETVGGQYSMNLNQWDTKVDTTAAIDVTSSLHLKALQIVIEAQTQLSLKVGGNYVDISVAGVAINGMPMVLINSGGAAGVGMGANPSSPDAPTHYESGKPPNDYFKKADDSKTGSKSRD